MFGEAGQRIHIFLSAGLYLSLQYKRDDKEVSAPPDPLSPYIRDKSDSTSTLRMRRSEISLVVS
jgi:hypothetical protein